MSSTRTKSTDPNTAEQRRPTQQRQWTSLIVLSCIQLLFVLDQTVVNIALPSIEHQLSVSPAQLTWIVNAYLVTAGGLLLLGGRLGDFFGRLRLFVLGTVVFSAGSLLCGLAPTANLLILGRFLQGGGEAMAAPAALALIALLFTDPKERAKAFGVWGAVSGLGSVLGVILSGLIVNFASWRFIFLINIPITVAVLALVPKFVKARDARDRNTSLDWLGAALITASAILLIHGLLSLSNPDTSMVGKSWPIIAAAVGIGLFVMAERRVSAPLIPARFFGSRGRVMANVCTVFLTSAMAAMFFLITLYVQNVLGFSPLASGLAYIPFCFAYAGGLALGAQMMTKLGGRVTVLSAFVVAAAGMLLLTRVEGDSTFVGALLAPTLLIALGLALGLPSLQNLAMQGLSEADAGLGSGVQTTVQQLGSALGLAVLASIAFASGGGTTTVAGFRWAFMATGVVLVVGAGAVALLPAQQKSADTKTASQPTKEKS